MDQLTAPRDLTEDETCMVRKLMKSELIGIHSSVQDEEDAEDLIEYAVDMIESGETVGHVVHELKFMEMPLCGDAAASRLSVCLMKFFIELEQLDFDGGDGGHHSNNENGKTLDTIETTIEDELPMLILVSSEPSIEEKDSKAEHREPAMEEPMLEPHPTPDQTEVYTKRVALSDHDDPKTIEPSPPPSWAEPIAPTQLSVSSAMTVSSTSSSQPAASDFVSPGCDDDPAPIEIIEPPPSPSRTEPSAGGSKALTPSSHPSDSPAAAATAATVSQPASGITLLGKLPSSRKNSSKVPKHDNAANDETANKIVQQKLPKQKQNGASSSSSSNGKSQTITTANITASPTHNDEPSITMAPLEEREQAKKQEREKKEAQKQELVMKNAPSLKQRLAAFEGSASSQKTLLHTQEGSASSSPKTTTPKEAYCRSSRKNLQEQKQQPDENEASSLKDDDVVANKDSKISPTKMNTIPKLSLKERVSAYQRRMSLTASTEEDEVSSTANTIPFNDNLKDQKQQQCEQPDENEASLSYGASTKKEIIHKSSKANTTTPRLSLKDRMAAFQGVGVSSSTASTEEDLLSSTIAPHTKKCQDHKQELSDENNDAPSHKDSTKSPEASATPRLSLKERMAAFQGGAVSTSSSEEEEEVECDNSIDDTPISMKDRLADFQRRTSPQPTTTEETDDEDSKLSSSSAVAAKNSPQEEKRTSLRERMAVFGQAKSTPKLDPPKKELTDVQQRMAMFSSKSSSSSSLVAASASSSAIKKKLLPPKIGGMGRSSSSSRGLKDRMAKYAETTGATEAEALFVAPKKKSSSTTTPKAKSFVPKKPKESLHSRMQKFEGSSSGGMTRTGNGKNEEPSSLEDATPAVGDANGKKKWKYQVKGASSSSSSSPLSSTTKTKLLETNKIEQSAEVTSPEKPGQDANNGEQSTPMAVSPKQPPINLKTRMSMYQANVVSPTASSASKKVIIPAGDLKGRMSMFQARPVSPDTSESNKRKEPSKETIPLEGQVRHFSKDVSEKDVQEPASDSGGVSSSVVIREKSLDEVVDCSAPSHSSPEAPQDELHDEKSMPSGLTSPDDAFHNNEVEAKTDSPNPTFESGEKLQNGVPTLVEDEAALQKEPEE